MTMKEIQEHNFGFETGQVINIKAGGSTLKSVPPFDGNVYTVKITNEYPFLFTGIVYPHRYRNKDNLSDSFRTSICKVDIIIGEVKVLD